MTPPMMERIFAPNLSSEEREVLCAASEMFNKNARDAFDAQCANIDARVLQALQEVVKRGTTRSWTMAEDVALIEKIQKHVKSV